MADTSRAIRRDRGQHAIYLSQWAQIRDCIENTVWSREDTYLPYGGGMNDKQYNNYHARAIFYDFSELLLKGLVGMALTREPVIEVPDAMKDRLELFTDEGDPIMTMIRAMLRAQLSLSRYGLLVDLPEVVEVGYVPYVATYDAESITDWEQRIVDGVKKTTMVEVVFDTEDVDDGSKETFEHCYRLTLEGSGYDVYTVRHIKRRRFEGKASKDGEEEVAVFVPSIGGQAIDFIPFEFVNGTNRHPALESPAMYGYSCLNIGHYRNSADYEQALHMTANPTPCISGYQEHDGEDGDDFTLIGPGTVWKFPNPQAKAYFMEYSGSGVTPTLEAMREKKESMAAMGARMIREDKRSAESGDRERLRVKGEGSLLMGAVLTAEQAIRRILRMQAAFAQRPDNEIESIVATFNKDFIETDMSGQDLNAVVSGWLEKAYSKRSMHAKLQRGSVVPHDRTYDEEQELIAQEIKDGHTPSTPTVDEIIGNEGQEPAPAPPKQDDSETSGATDGGEESARTDAEPANAA